MKKIRLWAETFRALLPCLKAVAPLLVLSVLLHTANHVLAHYFPGTGSEIGGSWLDRHFLALAEMIVSTIVFGTLDYAINFMALREIKAPHVSGMCVVRGLKYIAVTWALVFIAFAPMAVVVFLTNMFPLPDKTHPSPYFFWEGISLLVGWLGSLIFLFWFLVRFSFLPSCVAAGMHPAIRGCWLLMQGQFWRLFWNELPLTVIAWGQLSLHVLALRYKIDSLPVYALLGLISGPVSYTHLTLPTIYSV